MQQLIALYRMCMRGAPEVLYATRFDCIADAWPAFAFIFPLQGDECTDFSEQVKVGG